MTYLKPQAVLEPLFHRWYAWPHLISPATSAMNVAHRHLPIMDSYLAAPAMHERFAADPQMIGGPFLGHPRERSDEVRILCEATRCNASLLIEFAAAVGELHELLEEEAKGGSLGEIYERVPEILRGYVELFYDLGNRPGFRFFEALLYRSPYYDPSAQSIALYLLGAEEDRPFVLSTPRLEDEDIVHLPLPFDHPGIDELARMRTEEGSYSRVRELLEVPDDKEPLFRTLFTDEAPARRATNQGPRFEIRYLGHACLLFECDGLVIMTDPVIGWTAQEDVPADTYADLPDRIDVVLITHNHQDHVLFETLLQLRHKIGTIVVPRNGGGTLEDPSLGLMFKAVGFDDVVEIGELDQRMLPGCIVTGVPFIGEHSDLNIRGKLCYHLRFDPGPSVLLVADSCNLEPRLYRHVHELTGDADILFLGMECDGAPLSWLYGPLLPARLPRDFDQSRRLAGSNCGQGMALVDQFGPSQVYVYAMGQEPWLSHVMGLRYTPESQPILASDALVSACRARGIEAKRLFGREVVAHDC